MNTYKNNQYKEMVSGFSKLSKPEKLGWMVKHFFTSNPVDVVREFASFWHSNIAQQRLFDGISENTLTNFYMPYGVAPNFRINNRLYCVPMVIEESSVVAAASSAAKFWASRGGFNAKVISFIKEGHVHFSWKGDSSKFQVFFQQIKSKLIEGVKHITANMEKRGGGITNIELLHLPEIEEGYYQLKASFDTCDAMGANFINSVLEGFAEILVAETYKYEGFSGTEQELKVIMAILSNYTPKCIVNAWVSCPIKNLGKFPDGMSAEEFAFKFHRAIHIAKNDSSRATTHNKGIFNGIDSVVIATGNDFRAIEACGHTYAARNGKYASLSDCHIENDVFHFNLEIPLAVGTVGGLTTLHPLAKRSLQMLGNPNAEELMQIIASVGLAQNFAAVRSLVTTGIQKGHMKMHLSNILTQFEATPKEREHAMTYFSERTISFSEVRNFLTRLREGTWSFSH